MKILSASLENTTHAFFHAGYISASSSQSTSVNFVLILFMVLASLYLYKQIKEKKKITLKNIIIYVALMIILFIGFYEIFFGMTFFY